MVSSVKVPVLVVRSVEVVLIVDIAVFYVSVSSDESQDVT